MSTPPFLLRTLGRAGLEREGRSVPAPGRGIELLAYLLVAGEDRAQRELVQDLLWPEVAPADRAQRLRALAHELRRKAGLEAVTYDSSWVYIDRNVVTADVLELRSALGRGDAVEGAAWLRGRFLQGRRGRISREFDRWIEVQDARLGLVVERTVEAAVGELLREGQAEAAATVARAGHSYHPLNEGAVSLLASTLLRAERPLPALEVLHAHEVEIAPETPSAELRDLEEKARARLHPVPLPETVPSPRPRGTRQKPPQRREARSAAGRLLLAAGVVALVFTIGRVGQRGGTTPASHGAPTPLLVVPVALWDAGPGWLRVSADGVDVLADSTLTSGELPAPDGRATALVAPASHGRDLAIRWADGRVDTVLTSEADEVAVAWGPLSRRLLVKHGRAMGQGDYRLEPLVLEVETGRAHRLPQHASDRDWSTARPANWAPSGTLLAISRIWRGREEIRIIEAGGAVLGVLAEEGSRWQEPAWSPDEGRLLFIRETTEGYSLETAARDGSSRRSHLRTFDPIRSPFWLGQDTICAILDQDDRPSLVCVEADEGERVFVPLPANVVRIETDRASWSPIEPDSPDPIQDLSAIPGASSRSARARPVEVRISSRFDEVAVRELVELDVEVIDAEDGEPVERPPSRYQWSLPDPVRSEILDSRFFRAHMEGAFSLSGGYPSWSVDTVPIDVVPTRENQVAALVRETWDADHFADWTHFGSPRPVLAVRAGGAAPHGLLVNGDDSYASGLVWTNSFPVGEGLTLEVEASLPASRADFQNLDFGWVARHPPAVGHEAWEVPRVAAVHLRRDRTTVWGPDRATDLPPVEEAHRWRRYAVQMHPDGTVSLVVDGEVRFRSPPGGPAPPGRLYPALWGNTVGADLLFGAVTLYRGVRYTVG